MTNIGGEYQYMRKILKNMTEDQLYEFLIDLEDFEAIRRISYVSSKLIEDTICGRRSLKSEYEEAKEIDEARRYRESQL